MKKLLYVFDNVNYVSGVQKVTAAQIKTLKNIYKITIFSLEQPLKDAKELFENVDFLIISEHSVLKGLSNTFNNVMSSSSYTLKQKMFRLLYGISIKMRCHNVIVNVQFERELKQKFEEFEIVCVISEASKLRKLVSKLSYPKKVQWIHTDYSSWSKYSAWTKTITHQDRHLYERYNKIVCLSNISKKGFLEIHQGLEEKVVVIANLNSIEEIKRKSKKNLPIEVDQTKVVKIITIGRLEGEKAYGRILRLCLNLKINEYSFCWYIVGNGTLMAELRKQCFKMGLDDVVHFTGALENPYPLLLQSDLFALLSIYEGLPVTIDEAKILGTPVIATNVGGIPEQIEHGLNGFLVDNNEEIILIELKKILDKPNILKQMKRDDMIMETHNIQIVEQLKQLF